MLVADIVDQDRAVIEPHSQQGRAFGVEVKTHNTRLCGERVLWMQCVLNGKQTNKPCFLAEELVTPETHCEEIGVSRVPT